MTDTDRPRTLSYRRASRLYDVPRSTLRRRVREGAIRATRSGRLVLLDADDVDRLYRPHAHREDAPTG